MFAGAGENECWEFTAMFDAMGALSTQYNDSPKTASRAFDQTRDGFVIAGGGGIVVLEELEHAKKRGAKIYGARPAERERANFSTVSALRQVSWSVTAPTLTDTTWSRRRARAGCGV